MKQITLPLITLLILALSALSATAYDFEVDGIYYNINGTEATVTGVINGYTGEVTIPESVTYDGTTYSVTSIGNWAFMSCYELTSIIIPNSVTSIGKGAFENCVGLTSIIIPNSITSIGEVAFDYCESLTSISIPNSVTSIEMGTFYGCSSLTSFTIPHSVSFIGSAAFNRCYNLTNITCLAIKPPTITDAFPSDVTNQATLHVPRESLTAYQSADNWKDFSRIDDIVFEKDGIWYSALTDSTTMVIQKPGEESYYQGDIVIPEAVTYAGTTYSVISIGQGAFHRCSGLTSITIPNSVTTIGYAAFYGCSGLTSITIPNSVLSIGFGAFDSCSGLTSITIPNSVTSIGYLAFESCSGLTSMKVENGNPVFDSRNNCNAIIETATNKLIAGCMNTIIPNSVTAIGIDAFFGCTGLASITIPNSVTTIDGEAFGGCSSLTSITIPNSVTYIEERAFSDCTGLTCVTCLAFMPPTIYSYESIGAFPGDVTSQATLYVPRESLTAYQEANNWKDFSKIVGIPEINDFVVDGVWYRALDENTVMVIQIPDEDSLYQGDVVIPDSVSYLGYTFFVTAVDASAFEDCYELTSVVIGDAVDTIGENAFQGCTELTSVTIGSGVTSIGAKAFNYCNALQTVTCRGTVPPVMANTNCFSNAAYSRATLLVPRLQIEAYQAADYWYRFSNIEGWGSAGMGDVNADGAIGISDVTALTNALLTNNTDPALLEYGDLNHNGRLDIGDVTSLIVILLSH